MTLTAAIFTGLALARALDQARGFLRRFVVLTDDQATSIALWVAHTHAFAAAECTPYLQVTSATKRAGKTRLLEVLDPLVAVPWFTGRTSAAALMRKIDAVQPTLLLDETDAAFGGEKDYAEALRGLLNSGYRKSGTSTVCVGQGSKITARDFRTFCPKALAGIGRLPDTVADRAIPISLKRRTADEPCERWRERDGHREASPIRQAVAAAIEPLLAALAEARPGLPAALSDRQADVWEPLFALADAAGGDWPTAARKAAQALMSTSSVEDEEIAIQLLSDCRDLFTTPDRKSALFSKALCEGLCGLEDRPWSAFGKAGKPISGQAVAKLLRAFGVRSSGTIRIGQVTGKGYWRDSFEDAWARYLPIEPSHGNNANKSGPESPNFEPSHSESVTEAKTPNSSITTGVCDGVTVANPDHALVTLSGGLTVPVAVLNLVTDLEFRGIVLAVDKTQQLVMPTDPRLTAADQIALRRWRHHLAAVIQYQLQEELPL